MTAGQPKRYDKNRSRFYYSLFVSFFIKLRFKAWNLRFEGLVGSVLAIKPTVRRFDKLSAVGQNQYLKPKPKVQLGVNVNI